MSLETFLSSHFFTFGFIWIGLSFLGFTLPSFILGCQVYARRDHIAISKRRPQLWLLVLTGFVTYAGISLPVNWFYNINAIASKMYNLKRWQQEMIHGIGVSVYSFGFYLMLISFSMRTWLIHYDVSFAQCFVQSRWVSFIQSDTIPQNFYITYKSSLGSFAFLKKYMFGLLFVLVTQEIGFSIYLFHIHSLTGYANWLWIDLTMVALTVVFNLVVRYKTPYLDDEWDISFELSSLLKFEVICCVVFGVVIALPLEVYTRRFAMNLVLCLDVWVCTVCIIVFGWYFVRYDKKVSSKIGECLNLTTFELHANGSSDVLEVSTRDWLQDQLASLQSVNQFMAHLMKEFSHENLLFVIECNQFQSYMVEKYELDLPTMFIDPEIPLSSIVASEDLNDIGKATELFYKYINAGSLFEVNLSWGCRSHLTDLFLDGYEGSEESLAVIFDGALAEIISLMGASCRRFKH